MTIAFPMIEKAVRQLVSSYPPAEGKTGGDPSFDPEDVNLFFVEITLISGSTDQISGEWTLDLDCYGRSYNTTMGHALALEAILVGPRHVTDDLRIDNVYQNEAPAERPWDDDGVFRIGATYVFTARRSG